MCTTGTCPQHRPMSVADDRLDSLVQKASAPSLATLFQQAKQAGVIGAVSNYAGASGGA